MWKGVFSQPGHLLYVITEVYKIAVSDHLWQLRPARLKHHVPKGYRWSEIRFFVYYISILQIGVHIRQCLNSVYKNMFGVIRRQWHFINMLSVYLMSKRPNYFHAMLYKWRYILILVMPNLSRPNFFWTPFAFVMFDPLSSIMLLIFGCKPTCSAIGRHAHLSFIAPRTFLLPMQYRGWSFG